jgi:hypothetical protein
MNKGESRAALRVAAVGAITLASLGALVRSEPTPRGDDLIYENMARNPFGTHTFPFGFRLGIPEVVHLLPFDHTTSFRLLAWLGAAVAAYFAYLLMREVGAGDRLAGALAMLMCLSPPFLLVIIRNGRNTDIATVALMMSATYFVVRRRYWQLAVTLMLGVTAREAVLFVIPLAYAIWATGFVDLRSAARTLVIALPAIAVYAVIRLRIHTVGEAQVPGYGGSLLGSRLSTIELGLRTPFREARRLMTTYGPLWLIAPLALRDLPFARRGLVLVATSLLAMTFALDWGRMALFAAPVFYPAAAYVLSRHRAWRLPTLAIFLALVAGYAVYMDRSGVQRGIVGSGAPPYPVR